MLLKAIPPNVNGSHLHLDNGLGVIIFLILICLVVSTLKCTDFLSIKVLDSERHIPTRSQLHVDPEIVQFMRP